MNSLDRNVRHLPRFLAGFYIHTAYQSVWFIECTINFHIRKKSSHTVPVNKHVYLLPMSPPPWLQLALLLPCLSKGTCPRTSISAKKKCPKMPVNTARCPVTIWFTPAWDLVWGGESTILHNCASGTAVKSSFTLTSARAVTLLPQQWSVYPAAASYSTACGNR